MSISSEEKIKQAAKPLFWRFGLQKTPVDQICKNAGVSKMTFYRLFKNKEQVAISIFIELLDTNIERFEEVMSSDISFKEKMEFMIQLKKSSIAEMSNQIIDDLYSDKFPELMNVMARYQKLNHKRVIHHFEIAKKNGQIRAGIQMHFIFLLFDFFNELMHKPEFLKGYSSHTDAIMEITELAIYGLGDHK